MSSTVEHTELDHDVQRYETTGAKRVCINCRRALMFTGLDPDTAGHVAHDVAGRIEDAYRHRAERLSLRPDDLDRLNRAELTHTFRSTFRWDGQETERAAFVLTQIEAVTGVRFPEPTERQRFYPTSLSVWDKLTNRWACYGPEGCGAWVSGDGVRGLQPNWCNCGNRVQL